MRKVCAFVFVVLALAAEVAAQPALPVCKRPVTLGEFIAALRYGEHGDRKILNADCEKIVTAFNETFKLPVDEQPKSCEELAQYFERLNVTAAPLGVEASFTRILRNGTIDLYGFSREVRPKEEWAYDNQMGLWTMSMYCCNFISKNELPIPMQHVDVTPPPPSLPPPPSPPTSQTPIADAVREQPVAAQPAQGVVEQEIREESGNPLTRFGRWYGKHKKWTIPATALAIGAAVAGFAADFGTTKVTVTQTVVR